MKNSRYLVLVILGVVLIGGGILFFGDSEVPDEPEQAAAVEESLEPTAEPILPTNTAEMAEEPTEEVQASTPTVVIPPTPRTELEGTDPSTVNLASGEIQLVEVFAFT